MADAGKIVITPKGAYSSTKTYEWLDEVSYNGNAYVALKTVTGVTPSDDGVNWRLFMSSTDVDANVLVPKFTEASTRSNIVSGENLSTMFGKIKKWFTDLKSHAFKDLVNNLTTETTGSALDASQGKILKDEVDGVNRKLSGIEEGAEATAATISGTNPTVTNSANAPLIYGKIKGYTEQKTLSGKNLLKITNTTETTDGITFTVNEDGNITINGTATADVNFDVTNIANITGNGNIKIKLFQLNGSYTGTVEHLAFTSDLGNAFLVPIGEERFLNTDVTYSVFRIKVSSGTVCNNLKVGFMVAEDVSEYEPFCGGIASPSPDYPQDIKGLGDSGTIEVKTCGKNLLDYNEIGSGFSTNEDGTSFSYSNGEYTITRVAHIYSGIFTYSSLLNVLNGKKIRLSFDAKTDTSGMSMHVELGKTGIKKQEITTSYNRYAIEIDLTYSYASPLVFYGNAVAGNMYIKNIMFEDITNTVPEDSTYEPYTESTATIPIDTLYKGDYLEVYADGTGQIVRKNKVFENPTLTNSSGLWYWFNGGGVLKPYTNCYCNKLNHADSKIGTDKNGNVVLQLLEGQSIDDLATSVFVCKLATPTSTPLTAEQVQAFKQLYTFDNVTNFFCDGEITARYYCNTDSGDTVGMIQETVDGLQKTVKEIPDTYTTQSDFDRIVGGTVSDSGLTNVSYIVPNEISDGSMSFDSYTSGTLVDALRKATNQITMFLGTLFEEGDKSVVFENDSVAGTLEVFRHKLSEGTYLLDIKVTITSITETLSGNGPSVDLTLQDIGFEDNIIAIRESECLLASYYPLIVNGSSYCLGGGMVSTENSTKGFYLRFLPHKNTKGSISSNNKSVLSGTMMIKVVEQQL